MEDKCSKSNFIRQKKNLIGDIRKKIKNRGIDELGLNLCRQNLLIACRTFMHFLSI